MAKQANRMMIGGFVVTAVLLLAASLVTVAGAVAGAHGWMF